MAPPSPFRGNALFIILIAVALFAALSYAVTQSGRGGTGIRKEQTSIVAAQIVQYATLVETSVQRMLLTGTSLAALTFCSSGDTDGLCSTGGVTPDTAVCDTGTDCLFAVEGGGVSPLLIPEAAGVGGSPGWAFVELNSSVPIALQGVGTAVADLYMTNANLGLSQDVCEAINKGLDLPLPVQDDANAGADGVWAGYSGAFSKCISVGSGSSYWYLHTLVAR